MFVFAICGFAQGTTSRLTGTVTDNAGAAVSGATVTLTDEATNTSLTAQTSDSGTYTFDLIQAGTYQVSVEKQGFKKFVSPKNVINVNQPATVNVSLEIGSLSATVTVESKVEEVQTSSSGNIGSTIEQRTVESLPIVGLRGRNPLDLLTYQPGVNSGANTGGGVHVNGSRDRAFNFTLDGIDINESSAGGANFTPLRPNPDSIQEFQLVTSNFTAELGRSSGAQVTFVTRSGTNRFSGNVFEYYQTPDFNANEYQNNLNGRAKNQFVQHIFGGSFGGPLFDPGFGEGTKPRLLKDKAFFFVNLQLLRAYDTALVTRPVYTSLARGGVFRYVVGGQNAPTGTSTPSVNSIGAPLFPNCSATVTTGCIATYNINANQTAGTGNPTATGLDPALLAVINSAPLPNNFSISDGLNTAGFDFASPQHERQYDFTSRFDFKIANNKQLYVRYSQGVQNSFGDSANGGRPIFPNSPNLVDTFRTPKNLAINFRYSPTANLTNEAIFGLNKFGFIFKTPTPDPAFPYAFNLQATPNTNFSFNARKLRTYQYVDNVTYVTGKHVFKGGINFRFGRQVDDRSSVAGSGIEPIVSFSTTNNSYTAFSLPSTGINTNDLARLRSTINDLLGRVGSVSQAYVSDPSNPSQFAPAGTRYIFTAFYPEYDFYFQDTWRYKPNLVFDLGLRYEIKLSPSSEGRPILAPDRQINFGTPATNTIKFVEKKLFRNDYNNFGPSVGFAYDPFKTGKNSIRANFRLSYDRFPSQLFSGNIFQSTPGNALGPTASYTGTRLLREGLDVLTAPLTPTTTPAILRQPIPFSTSGLTILDSDVRYPEVYEYSLSFQREIGKGFVFESDYIRKRGVHLFGGYDANQVNIKSSGFGQNFLDAFNLVRGDSTYNSPLINALFTGNPANNAGTATFRSLNTTAISQGGVGAAAAAISQRTCQNSDVTAGFCSAAGGQLIASTIGNPFFFQKFPQFTGALNVLDSNDVSLYNGLEIIMKRRITNGLGFQFGYTFSKSQDTRSFDPTFSTVSRANAQSASSTPFDINNRRLNYAPSDFDRRHSLQGTYVYELPFGRGKRFGSEIPKPLDLIIGGWQIAGNLVWTSGRPFTVYSGVNTFSNVVQSTADCNGCDRHLGSVVQESGTNFFFDAGDRAKFSIPVPGSTGSSGRNFFIGPRFFQTDVSISKKFKFTERFNFELRVDAKNLTNTPSFDIPTATFTSTIFGRIRDGVVSSSRRIQISGKINF
ncbi:MAG: carboxypeptidase regulatory-like domain-containing protein [Pyrinomonadaceae bacterium]